MAPSSPLPLPGYLLSANYFMQLESTRQKLKRFIDILKGCEIHNFVVTPMVLYHVTTT